MSFDKNYPNRKDHREAFIGAKSFDRTCRNGGSCPACQGNRTIRKTRTELSASDDIAHVLEELDTSDE